MKFLKQLESLNLGFGSADTAIFAAGIEARIIVFGELGFSFRMFGFIILEIVTQSSSRKLF